MLEERIGSENQIECLTLGQQKDLLPKVTEEICLGGLTPEKYGTYLNDFGDRHPFNLETNLLVISAIVNNPTMTSKELAASTSLSTQTINDNQLWMQESKMLHDIMTNHYYPGYIFVRYAQSFLKDLKDDPTYLERVLSKEPVAPKRLEVHVTKASCNYNCDMCLWRVKGKGKYSKFETESKPLTIKTWKGILTDAKKLGTNTVIFSGGGEMLLRTEAAEVISHTKEIGLDTLIYTNGSKLVQFSSNSPMYQALLNADWLRVSLHSTTEDCYGELVGIPKSYQSLSKVLRGIERLKNDRDRLSGHLKIGIGFVIQSKNYDQVEQIANMSADMGIDFLNLRVDCIDITKKLEKEENEILFNQLRTVREKMDLGKYGNMDIDFADSLIGRMNRWNKEPKINFTNECRVHLYRSSINPFGRVAVCDLTAEPFYSRDEFTLGYVKRDTSYRQVISESSEMQFDAKLCIHCMPGQQAINALWFKVIEDYKDGVKPEDQPLCFKNK